VKRCSVKNNTANSPQSQNDIILGTNPGYGGGIGSLSGTVVIEDSDVAATRDTSAAESTAKTGASPSRTRRCRTIRPALSAAASTASTEA
jgi:hypothetical protein